MTTYKEIKYRTLDDLIDSCSIDLRNYYADGTIELAELIKIVHKCNYQLGLQIQKTKETIIEVEHHRAKLPADFNFLNFAFLCHEYHEIIPSIGNDIVKIEHIIPPISPEYTTVPCIEVTVVDAPTTTIVNNADGTSSEITFPIGTTNICALSVNIVPNLTTTTNDNCIKLPSGLLSCQKPFTNCEPCNRSQNSCSAVDTDPWKQNKVYSVCNDTIGIEIVQENRYDKRSYRHITPLYIQPSREASDFNSYEAFRLKGNIAVLRDGFLETAFECGKVYINYQGSMEDDDGNLLVLDHPSINLWYEAEVSYRILRNLYINGEPDIERRLQLLDKERKEERAEAMKIAYTPDFNLMKQTFEIFRDREYQKHFAPFSMWYGVHGLSIWFNKFFNGRYRE